MAYVAKPSGTYSGVYRYLLECEERWAVLHPGRDEFVSDTRGGFFRCPHHRRLVALRSGEPVSVPGYLLPPQVRESGDYRRAARGARAVTATVFPDSRIAYRPETAQEWMAEHLPDETIVQTGVSTLRHPRPQRERRL